MQIGWIDFSKADRDKAFEALRLLDGPRAVDELGFGRIRDAFANYFFPGTSTIQTRAKYFFIVPYAFQEALENDSIKNSSQLIREVEEKIERKCAEILIGPNRSNLSQESGIIGSVSLNQGSWVSRKPSSIYWNGLRRFRILTKNLSMGQYAELALAQKERMSSAASMRHVKGRTDDFLDYDDKDAGGGDYENYWSIQPPSNWKDNLKIELLPEEADVLHRHISQSTKGSLLQLYLDNYVEAEKASGFLDLVGILSQYMDSQSKELAEMAIDFDKLTYMAKVRFNIMLTQHNDETLIDEWKSLLNEYRTNSFDLDIDKLFVKLRISSGGDWGLKSFLKSIQSMIKEDGHGVEKLDELIRKRERGIKGAASKLDNVNGYSVKDRAGYDHYDYRFYSARRIVRDIITAEKP